MKKLHQVKEFGYIDNHDIEVSFFDALKEFASYKENYNILRVAKGGNSLQTQQYVGTLTTKSGHVLEILPKIDATENDNDFVASKEMFFKMLQSLNNSPFRQYNNTSIDTKKSSILEIFITFFLQELGAIVTKGIKQDYVPIEGNFPFMKGKLNIAKHIQYNHTHKERFYIEFDVQKNNIAENRIIKSTLLLLKQISRSFQNKALVAKYLDIFDDVAPAINLEKDFGSYHFNRTNEYYRKTITWCEIFLSKHSFHIYSGKKIAYALLFDMQYLFESFVTQYCKQNFYGVTAQARWHHLIEKPNNVHILKPDIVIGSKENCIILDAKWKDYAKKNKVSSGDLYQLYAYGKKYNTSNVCLIYPKSSNFTQAETKTYSYDKDLSLHILCFDCVNDKLYHNGLLDASSNNENSIYA